MNAQKRLWKILSQKRRRRRQTFSSLTNKDNKKRFHCLLAPSLDRNLKFKWKTSLHPCLPEKNNTIDFRFFEIGSKSTCSLEYLKCFRGKFIFVPVNFFSISRSSFRLLLLSHNLISECHLFFSRGEARVALPLPSFVCLWTPGSTNGKKTTNSRNSRAEKIKPDLNFLAGGSGFAIKGGAKLLIAKKKKNLWRNN